MKLFRLTLFVFVLVFVLGMTRWSMALESKSKVRVFRLDEKVETLPKLKQTNRRGGYKRVMADRADIRVVDQLRLRGCVMRHRLRREVSFDCPEEMVFELGVREARIFQIMDLRAGEQIKADQVWQEGIRGAGVGVVVLDTGVDSGHVELSDSILGQKDFVDNDDIAEDPNGHGTHVVGIITANGINQVNGNYATGVAPESGIYMLRVCDANGSCFEDDMMAAMEYAVNNLTGAKVMSISIGGGNYGSDCDDDPLAAKVNWVANNGFLVTVAAGNDGSGVSSPACASKAMAIGTVDETGIVPYWSNRGSSLDIVAPGVSILSTYSCLATNDCSSTWYAHMSGTSMSTPQVAGVAALLWQTNPTATIDEIKNALVNNSDPASGCQKCRFIRRGRCYYPSVVACNPENEGAGVVNAYEAYLAIKPIVADCTTDNDCGDNLYCNGTETCVAGLCQAGETVNCSDLDDQCQLGVCDENQNNCVTKTKTNGTTCDDSKYCTVSDSCQNGTCSGSTRSCEDNNACTTDQCSENEQMCVNDEIPSCQITELCWSGDSGYLYRSRKQVKKFCKCAEGSYGYGTYNSKRGRKTVYRYMDANDNENWQVDARSARSGVDQVRCLDNSWYDTNQDYYR